ncbi:MAG: flavodoxin-dependent (E)-4-hydroxy-3-methylbut-2-enyl-diphosphate synthase [Clostridia bacterium]|nr:flavodoxin-dependent (E)-4-hydroxy-3-methylbut-2-enyl-diphosphate synthase [Clostridia bacterium]
MNYRNNTKSINVGGVLIGGDAPVTVQSMTNTKTADVRATVEQIKRLTEAGCDIIRVTAPDMESAAAIKEIKKQITIPLVADIHFDYRIAIECIKNGADKIRLNPGNIGGEDRVRAVAEVAKERGVPIRIGVNSGSVGKDLIAKYGGPTTDAVLESAFTHINMLYAVNFNDIAVSLKTSNVVSTIDVYKKFANVSDLPLHVGVTEAGTAWSGSIKSSVGIGSILSMGIGNTIRVSLTGDPVEEVRVGKQILKSLELTEEGVNIISCPTCGRTNVDLVSVVTKVEDALKGCKKNITVAVMGCAVNGPGEAREADYGVACGKGEGLLFKKGEIIKKVRESEIASALVQMIQE